MVQIEHLEYISIAKKFVNKPFDVTNAWVEYQKSKGSKVLFFVDSIEQPQILSWARIKKVKFIGEVIEVLGPIYKETVTVKQLSKFFEGYKDLPYNGVFVNLCTEYDVKFEVACRKVAFKRPVGQSNTSLTIIVNTDKFSPDRNWRRNVKSAHQENFNFELKRDVNIKDCETIERLHAENSKMKSLGYSLQAKEIQKLTQEDNIYCCFLNKDDVPIAARIISVEENISYDIFACNSLESRKNGATQFLMQSIFEYLNNNSIKFFDFSRIPVGKKGAKGVYEFKNATRGDVIQYNGEWVFFKNKKLRHLYYIFNLIINKKDFY